MSANWRASMRTECPCWAHSGGTGPGAGSPHWIVRDNEAITATPPYWQFSTRFGDCTHSAVRRFLVRLPAIEMGRANGEDQEHNQRRPLEPEAAVPGE